MQARIFSARIKPTKSKLETDIEWRTKITPELEQQIIATHVSAFMDLYRPYTEKDLGLKPGLTKEAWLTNMIKDELEQVKKGSIYLATITVHDQVAGFITCDPIKARHTDLKLDVYIGLLAVRPFRDFKTKNKIRIGLGQELVQAAEDRFVNANTFTLDTRIINPAIGFYEHIGFSNTGRHTFGGNNPDYYVGFEKAITRSLS